MFKRSRREESIDKDLEDGQFQLYLDSRDSDWPTDQTENSYMPFKFKLRDKALKRGDIITPRAFHCAYAHYKSLPDNWAFLPMDKRNDSDLIEIPVNISLSSFSAFQQTVANQTSGTWWTAFNTFFSTFWAGYSVLDASNTLSIYTLGGTTLTANSPTKPMLGLAFNNTNNQQQWRFNWARNPYLAFLLGFKPLPTVWTLPLQARNYPASFQPATQSGTGQTMPYTFCINSDIVRQARHRNLIGSEYSDILKTLYLWTNNSSQIPGATTGETSQYVYYEWPKATPSYEIMKDKVDEISFYFTDMTGIVKIDNIYLGGDWWIEFIVTRKY